MKSFLEQLLFFRQDYDLQPGVNTYVIFERVLVLLVMSLMKIKRNFCNM